MEDRGEENGRSPVTSAFVLVIKIAMTIAVVAAGLALAYLMHGMPSL